MFNSRIIHTSLLIAVDIAFHRVSFSSAYSSKFINLGITRKITSVTRLAVGENSTVESSENLIWKNVDEVVMTTIISKLRTHFVNYRLHNPIENFLLCWIPIRNVNGIDKRAAEPYIPNTLSKLNDFVVFFPAGPYDTLIWYSFFLIKFRSKRAEKTK